MQVPSAHSSRSAGSGSPCSRSSRCSCRSRRAYSASRRTAIARGSCWRSWPRPPPQSCSSSSSRRQPRACRASSSAHVHQKRAARGTVVLTALIVAVLTALSGCGQDSSTPAAAPTEAGPVSTMQSPFASLQQQFEQVVRAVSPQVVQIQSRRGLGSGVVFDDRANVVTNAHVVAGARQFVVTLSGGDRHPATLVGSDPSHDLAVVHVSGGTLAAATFADSSKAQVGDLILAIDNPLGLRSSVTEGIVSSLNRSVSEGHGVTLASVIQTSAAINPGNSGGALVDLTGRVIGIPTLEALDPELGETQAAGIGFAIPSDTVRKVAAGLIASG